MKLLVFLTTIVVTTAVKASTFSQVIKLQSECGTLYTVVSGDDCFAIAGAAHITPAQLQALNPNLKCAALQLGAGVCLGLPCGKTYQVASGDWCAKIESDQGVSDADLMSLNPGLACTDIFPGQLLCIAPPPVTPPGDPVPPSPTPLPEPVTPSVPCKIQVAIKQGDTCWDLATNNGLQLSQFTALNANLNCSVLTPGDIACVIPACGEIYVTQLGDFCSRIEQKKNLTTGKLVTLNPGLDCNTIAPLQTLCIEDPPAAAPPSVVTPDFTPMAEYPVLSPGNKMSTSPIMDFLHTQDPRKSIIGHILFQLDSQHQEVFAGVDLNGDGHIDRSEMDRLLNMYPILLRGLSTINASFAQDVITNTTMSALDLNGDGVISQQEYLFGIYKGQKAVREVSGTGSSFMRRDDGPSILPPGLLGFSSAQLSYILSRMQAKANASGGDLAKYLGVAFWDKSYTPEPQCSMVLYVSTSCGALGSNAAATCSEGGDRVYENSCRDNIGTGAYQCDMNGCQSLCYKINTDGCECDALKYTQENLVLYMDQPKTPIETVNNMVECRTKCSSSKACIGFNVGTNIDGATVRCIIYDAMNIPKKVTTGVSFRKAPNFNDVPGEDTCPPLTEGFRVSPSEFKDSIDIGEKAANDYADSMALASRDLERRASKSFDPRGTFRTPRKNQLDTGLCASFTTTTMVEASIMTKFKRTTANELSPLWVAMCAAKQPTYNEANTFSNLRYKLGKSRMMTESCVPFSTRDDLTCNGKSGCYSPGDVLPYLTDSIHFPDANDVGVKTWDNMKEHISTIGPLYGSFQISKGFMSYARGLAGRSDEVVFYDGHPDWPDTSCPYGGHAMSIIGYGTYKQKGVGKDRLFWIIQNSWGISSGKNGYVFVAAGSMGQAMSSAYGIKVDERDEREL